LASVIGSLKRRGPALPAQRDYRRDLAQLREDALVTNVAGVNDQLASAEHFDRFGSQQAVGVGDDPDRPRTSHRPTRPA
jgi:hypothetical protein